MSDFRRIDDQVYASPQIHADDVAEAKKLGVTMIVNNRPEGESPDQTPGDDIARIAGEHDMTYRAIPITHAGFGEAQVDAMIEALDEAEGRVLAYCRSGTRSTLLWALAAAKEGGDPDDIAARAAGAGYDVAPIRQIMDMLAAGSR